MAWHREKAKREREEQRLVVRSLGEGKGETERESGKRQPCSVSHAGPLLARPRTAAIVARARKKEDVVVVWVEGGIATTGTGRAHHGDLGNVEPTAVLAEDLLAAEVEEKLAAVDVFHHEHQQLRGLEGALEPGQERVLGALQHGVLSPVREIKKRSEPMGVGGKDRYRGGYAGQLQRGPRGSERGQTFPKARVQCVGDLILGQDHVLLQHLDGLEGKTEQEKRRRKREQYVGFA